MYADRSNKNNVFELVTSNIATGLKWFLFLDENISHSRPGCDENPGFQSPSNFLGSCAQKISNVRGFKNLSACTHALAFEGILNMRRKFLISEHVRMP